MKITVLGASQGVGLEMVKLALAEGHEVTALARDAAKQVMSEPGLTLVADVADFMLKELRDPRHFGKTPLLSYV